MDEIERIFMNKMMAESLSLLNLHYVDNEIMTKDQFMDIQQKALDNVKKELS